MAFYGKLRGIYAEIINGQLLRHTRQMFRDVYAVPLESVPEVKALDFIFWSAGKLLLDYPQASATLRRRSGMGGVRTAA